VLHGLLHATCLFLSSTTVRNVPQRYHSRIPIQPPRPLARLHPPSHYALSTDILRELLVITRMVMVLIRLDKQGCFGPHFLPRLGYLALVIIFLFSVVVGLPRFMSPSRIPLLSVCLIFLKHQAHLLASCLRLKLVIRLNSIPEFSFVIPPSRPQLRGNPTAQVQ
jgi:hypothetical protein